jgi:hypothetical protein
MLCFLAAILLLQQSVYAQVKNERESDIKAQDVPANARSWMKDTYEGAKKYRWIQEESNSGISYEAKLKYQGHWHSVEFNANGIIEDIEVTLDFNDLDSLTKTVLLNALGAAFEDFKIIKTQRQWTGSAEDLEDAIDEGEIAQIHTRYELEVYGRHAEKETNWEVLIETDGQIISTSEIEAVNNTNLNF